MSEQQLFKAITRFPMDESSAAFIKSFMSNPASINYRFVEFIDSKVAGLRTELLRIGRARLEGQDRADHLLNAYLEWDKATCIVTATYVFSDRDTALMFKLALD